MDNDLPLVILTVLILIYLLYKAMFSNKENDKCDDKIIVIFFALVFIIYFKSKVN